MGYEIKQIFKRKRADETNMLINLYNEIEEEEQESDETEEPDEEAIYDEIE